jgi:hypothetical protein
VFPFHNLTFALWLEMVDPCFVTGDCDRPNHTGSKEVRDIQAIKPVLFRELVWKQLCTNFTEVKSIVDNFMGRICSWLTTSSTDTFRVPRIRAPTCSMFRSVVDMYGRHEPSSISFFNMSIHSYSVLYSKTLLPYCANNLPRIFALRILSSFAHAVSVAAMLTPLLVKDN